MARTQRADLAARAEALLDAAAALLLEGGTRRIRIDQVAARAGVGKGTVYLHWADRDHLLLAVGAREAAAILRAAIRAIEADPVEAAPHRHLRHHFLEAARRPVLRLVFDAEAPDLAALAGERTRTGLAAARRAADRDYLAALADHGLLRPGADPDDTWYGIQAVAHGFFASEPFQAPLPAEHRADLLADVLRRAFEPDPAPPPERYRAAAPAVLAGFTRLANAYTRTAYGDALD
ncbi:TetR/AcrR family transcriptional regulator [Glycomyces terrestris]|uniref:TetR/AcrR family transcriptional regulator n=1 Tax=Glycomyces terrestris TaxID=2493553 RepID=A0A426UV76_9ACTN|nr:TetR family transcriptional regulator [Glycomyces terrestris]RRR98224.1 TetR/AcrR family transcriptional regulator [Glycomyces terrestris]